MRPASLKTIRMSSTEAAETSSMTASASVLRCRKCLQVLASPDALLSRAFAGQHGRACLIEKVDNVTLGEVEHREMRTGWHSVSDIFCASCDTVLGWKYHTAQNASEKYKEGRFILELECIAREDIPALLQQDSADVVARQMATRPEAS